MTLRYKCFSKSFFFLNDKDDEKANLFKSIINILKQFKVKRDC